MLQNTSTVKSNKQKKKKEFTSNLTDFFSYILNLKSLKARVSYMYL